MFENRSLRRMTVRTTAHNSWAYSSPNIIRVIRSRKRSRAQHAARMGAMRNACTIFVGKLERKRLLKRYRCRWEDNIKMDIK
jgi:hypothetical protein